MSPLSVIFAVKQKERTTMNVTNDYVRKVVNFINNMKPGEEVDLSKSDRREDFMFVARIYIDKVLGREEYNISADGDRITRKNKNVTK